MTARIEIPDERPDASLGEDPCGEDAAPPPPIIVFGGVELACVDDTCVPADPEA